MIINPTVKSHKHDPRVSLNYRGISLLSTVYKLYSSILNERLTTFLEKINMLVEEQNGFRKGRACIDHIYTVCTVISNRLRKGLHMFVCYIDFQKAFDFINRNLLPYKLLEIGVNSKFYDAVKEIYRNPQACVRITDVRTGWFSTPMGVWQGNVLS